MPETLATTRHSGYSKRGNFMGKTFVQVINPAINSKKAMPASQAVRTKRETQAGRNGWERTREEGKGRGRNERTGKPIASPH